MGFLHTPTPGINQKTDKEDNFFEEDKSELGLAAFWSAKHYLLHNRVWALEPETIRYLIYKYNSGSGQYNFNLYDVLKAQVIHCETWVSQYLRHYAVVTISRIAV